MVLSAAELQDIFLPIKDLLQANLEDEIAIGIAAAHLKKHMEANPSDWADNTGQFTNGSARDSSPCSPGEIRPGLLRKFVERENDSKSSA